MKKDKLLKELDISIEKINMKVKNTKKENIDIKKRILEKQKFLVKLYNKNL